MVDGALVVVALASTLVDTGLVAGGAATGLSVVAVVEAAAIEDVVASSAWESASSTAMGIEVAGPGAAAGSSTSLSPKRVETNTTALSTAATDSTVTKIVDSPSPLDSGPVGEPSKTGAVDGGGRSLTRINVHKLGAPDLRFGAAPFKACRFQRETERELTAPNGPVSTQTGRRLRPAALGAKRNAAEAITTNITMTVMFRPPGADSSCSNTTARTDVISSPSQDTLIT